jgi:hypothetical protein
MDNSGLCADCGTTGGILHTCPPADASPAHITPSYPRSPSMTEQRVSAEEILAGARATDAYSDECDCGPCVGLRLATAALRIAEAEVARLTAERDALAKRVEALAKDWESRRGGYYASGDYCDGYENAYRTAADELREILTPETP